MSIRKPRALLVGEKPLLRSNLAQHLEEKGCECSFAVSYDEACSCLSAKTFDLVFSPMRLRGVTLFPLMDLLEGSEANLFYLHTVEEGYWCLPALHQGQRCFGASGLRSNEFMTHLDELIDSIRADRHAAYGSDALRSNAAAAGASASPAELLPPGSVRDFGESQKRKA